jgi:hypothetical protein
LQKCKHPNGKVPFFHELKSSQNPPLAWVHVQRLHICEKAQGMILSSHDKLVNFTVRNRFIITPF